MTYGLIALSVVAWLLQQVPNVPLTEMGAYMPALGYGEPWRFITSAFLHSPSQFMHILFNMLCLWQLGQSIEPFVGRARFLAIYLLTALGGSVGFLWISAPPADPGSTWFAATVGASGAVFGLFGVLLVLLKRLGGQVNGLIAILVINALLPLLVPGIAWQAHVGGFVTGLVLGLLIISTRSTRTPAAQWVAYLAVAAGLVALIMLKYWMVLGNLVM